MELLICVCLLGSVYNGPIFAKILYILIQCNIGGNVGNELNFVTSEQGLTHCHFVKIF